jgi:hypothetical protein
VYDSCRVCTEYVLGFSDTAYRSYFTRLEAKAAYAAFLSSRTKM